jgi:hypothetical protein
MISSRFRPGRRTQRRRAPCRVVSVSRQASFTVKELLDTLREFGPEHLPESLTALDQQELADNLREFGPEYLLESLTAAPHRDTIWEIVKTPEGSGKPEPSPEVLADAARHRSP